MRINTTKAKARSIKKTMKYPETIILDGDIQDEEELQLEKRGCPAGRVNFTKEDKQEMLWIIQNALPLGGKSWKSIGDMFNEWVKHNRHPERPFKSLEIKFKAVRTLFI